MTNLSDLKRLLAEATPGPWTYTTEDGGDEYVVMVPDRLLGKDGAPIVDHDGGLAPDVAGPLQIRFDNADLIVAMHAALPDLLAAVEAAREALVLLDDLSSKRTGLEELQSFYDGVRQGHENARIVVRKALDAALSRVTP